MTRLPIPSRRLLAALPVAAALTAPAAASATDVTVGSPLTAVVETNTPPGTCPTNTDCILFSAGVSGPSAVAPTDGTVDQWRVRAGSAGSPVRLRILRPNGVGGFTAAGTSTTQKTTAAGIDLFPASLPIHKGDVIALENDSNGLILASSGSQNAFHLSGPNGGETATFTPQVLADGMTGTPSPSGTGNLEVQVNADIAPAPSTGPGAPTGPSGPTTPKGTPGPTIVHLGGNPFGLPAARHCVDRRRFRIPVHQPRANGGVIRATIRVNGRAVRTVAGRGLASVALTRLPIGRFVVTVEALTTRNVLIISTRTYSGCRRSRRHDVRHHRG